MNHKISADKTIKEIVVQKGDTIEIELDESPTTGYSWEIAEIEGNVLGLQSSDYKRHKIVGIGGGGIRRLKFLVNELGNGSIKLKNWRKWSGDIYQQFQLDVKVQ